jgi:hypothetical protein
MRFRPLAAKFLAGVAVGAFCFSPSQFSGPAHAQQPAEENPDLASLQAEVERLKEVVPDHAGREIKLQEILQAVENSPLKQLEESIKVQGREKFIAAYEFMLTSCYSCHKASDKPYLRPRIPDHPASAI